jgi:hypothetical protein
MSIALPKHLLSVEHKKFRKKEEEDIPLQVSEHPKNRSSGKNQSLPPDDKMNRFVIDLG